MMLLNGTQIGRMRRIFSDFFFGFFDFFLFKSKILFKSLLIKRKYQ